MPSTVFLVRAELRISRDDPRCSTSAASKPPGGGRTVVMVEMDAVVLTQVAEMNKGLLRMGGHRPKSDGGLLEFVELDIPGLETESPEPPHLIRSSARVSRVLRA